MLRRLVPMISLLLPLTTLGDQAGGHTHTAAVAEEPVDPNAYYNQAAYDPSYGQYDPAYGQYDPKYGQYDPKYAEAFGYPYDYSDSELEEKQTGIGGPTAADFIPFIASFSLPLGAAVITFLALVAVAAAFLLFPQTIEIDTNARKKRSFEPSPYGVCDHSSSSVCRILESIVLSMDCLEVVSCEVAALAESKEFPMIGDIVKPFLSNKYYDRFASMDCSTLKCKAKNSSFEQNRI